MSTAQKAAELSKSAASKASQLLSSSSGKASQLLSSSSGAVGRIANRYPKYTGPIVYWGQVTSQIGKQVWIKEGLSPPSIAEFQQVYKNAFESLKSTKLSTYKDSLLSLSTRQAVQYSVYGLQIFGLFSIGEMVGRRRITGYKH